jgi:hypothetical protein
MASENYGKFIYGLRDLKVTNIGGTVQEDLDAAQTLTFSPTFTEAALRGDDVEKASMGSLSGGTASISAGGYSSAAMAIMFGKTLSQSGSTPNEITTLQLNQGDVMPYFKLYGLARDEAGGDVQVLLSKVKVTGWGGIDFSDENWFINSVDVRVMDDGTNGVIKILQHETTAALPSS